MNETSKCQVFDNVWDALADTPEDAENLKIRSDLMQKISAFINKKKITQSAAAKKCGLTQPRMNDLLKGKISKFSLDALVNIAANLGLHVHIVIEELAETA